MLGFIYHESSNYQHTWFKFASTSFYLHGLTTLFAISLIYYLIINNLFEYYYAFQHSSIELPLYFKISSFWEGQEGSSSWEKAEEAGLKVMPVDEATKDADLVMILAPD